MKHWLTVVIALAPLVAAFWIIAKMLFSQWREWRDSRNPNLVWSRVRGKHIEKFSNQHIGEELFWGNMIGSTGGTMGMNGVPD